MNYWIFKCNISDYLLSDRMSNPEANVTWRVTDPRFRHEIKAGDTAFIWETGPKGGVRAIMQITSQPEMMGELETEKPYYVKPDYLPTVRVKGTLKERNLSLPSREIKSTPGLEGLSVFAGNGYHTRGTNYPVTEAQAKILISQLKRQLSHRYLVSS